MTTTTTFLLMKATNLEGQGEEDGEITIMNLMHEERESVKRKKDIRKEKIIVFHFLRSLFKSEGR